MDKKIIACFLKLTDEQKLSFQKKFPNLILEDCINASPTVPEKINIILGWDKKNTAAILNAPNSQLQWVQASSAGVNNLPLQTFLEKKITLTNASGVQNDPITEHVLGMLLLYYRDFPKFLADQKEKRWDPNTAQLQTLRRQTMLICGTGNIGQTLAIAAQALEVNTIGINTTGKLEPGFNKCYPVEKLYETTATADVIVNALPLTDKTRHLYNDNFFQHVKPGVNFINIGRGASVDTTALINALHTKQVAFAGLDVFEEEPLPPASPLWEMKNVFITPHVAGHRPDYDAVVLRIFEENLNSWLKDGTFVRNQVDLTRGY